MYVHIIKCAEGRVNKVCSEYIGLVVMGTFNASIRRDEIPEDFRFLEGQASKGPSSSFLGRSSWTSRSKEWHSISTGTDVVFVVDGYAVMPNPIHEPNIMLPPLSDGPNATGYPRAFERDDGS